jgi:hypothetical protein
MPVRWTADLLVRLDWRKIVELVRALVVAGGCELGGTRVWPDAMVEFPVTQGKGSDAAKLVMRLAPWNRWTASFRCIEVFAADLAARGEFRGVYLAPGGVTASARSEGARRGIDLLDADELAATLNVLPAKHSKFFREKTLAGDPFVPSCPVCMRSLSQCSEAAAKEPAEPGLRDITYQRSDVVAERVVARRIEVLRTCEMQFLREVRARDVSIHGIAVGDFVCEGALVLHPGAILCGDVAARSVSVRPGAELRGETRILPGHQTLGERSPASWIWKCPSSHRKPACAEVGLQPHAV